MPGWFLPHLPQTGQEPTASLPRPLELSHCGDEAAMPHSSAVSMSPVSEHLGMACPVLGVSPKQVNNSETAGRKNALYYTL